VCPHVDRASALQARIKDLRLEGSALAFAGRDVPVGVDARALASHAWDLPALSAHYQQLDRTFSAIRPRDDRAMFIAHVQLVNAFQRLPAIDPGLPAALLPRDWNGARIIRRLEALRARWREPAHRYWRDLGERRGAD
jgi:phenylacetic acid degradation operon negative regulatory protein